MMDWTGGMGWMMGGSMVVIWILVLLALVLGIAALISTCGADDKLGAPSPGAEQPMEAELGFYDDHVLPHVINLAMRNRHIVPYRERVIPGAEGRVLEIGIGSGLNLPFYGPQVREIFGLEPSPKLIAMTSRAASRSNIPVTLVEGSAEAIPLDEASIDTVVSTWTLCSIPAAVQALEEMRRVLKPGGQLLFAEHGLAAEDNVRRWQDRLTPLWKRIGGGCHLNRPIESLIEQAGFTIAEMKTGYAKGPKPMSFMYEGRARP